MTTWGGRPDRHEAGQVQRHGWRAAGPELAITAAVVSAVALAAYAWAGPNAVVLVLVVCALAALALLRSLTQGAQLPDNPAEDWQRTAHRVITGFWRKRGMLADATAPEGSYDFELRATLQHLLAARLAERHGVSLYAEPETARRLFESGSRSGRNLWPWLDPGWQPAPGRKSGGIPPRTLAAIIDRLERL
jgi:hypothetical protein